MPARVSEAIVLRTYPFRESSLVVSFFTREQGKLRGVARGARQTKNNKFGSGLERMSLVRMYYSQREGAELVTCTGSDVVRSPFDLAQEFDAGVALDFMAEVSEYLLPAEEPFETYFRLLVAVLDQLHATAGKNIWPAVTYFSLWAVRLSGFLGELKLGAEGREIAEEMLRQPLSQLSERAWSKETAKDLRRALIREIEIHVEKKLLTAPILEGL